MLGRTRSGRVLAWAGAFGTVAALIAVLSPGTRGAGAAPERRPAVVLAAVRQAPEEPRTPLHREVDLRLVVAPVDGGDLAVFDAPGATVPSQVLPGFNELGNPLVLLAVEQQADWYRVLLQDRPNGSSAWVPVGAVTAAPATYEVDVSLSARRLDVVRIADRAVVLTTTAGIGAPASPTPTGLFYVREHFPTSGADHPYGPFAFGLSGHSDVYRSFGTGDGRLAIHGTNQPATIGAAASNGCLHVPNDVVLQLVPLLAPGTPVRVSA